MIGYEANYSRGKHTIPERDASRAYAVVHRVLSQYTDCEGPDRAEGVPMDRHAALLRPRWKRDPTLAPTLDDLWALVDELVRDQRPCNLDLDFSFLLRTGPGGELLPYPNLELTALRDPRLSSLSANVKHGSVCKLGLSLWWPFDEVDASFLRSHDTIFQTLGVDPSPANWHRISGTVRSRMKFDRGSLVPPPDDDVARRLHAAVLADPADVGVRLAYADWLTDHGDPLGEMLVIQAQLRELGRGDRRRPQLRVRERELLGAHGLLWSRVLVPRK